ncbi:transposase [bacterium SM23_31]|nr:MAG: transposase [bacterium SM23_31]
MQAKKPPLRPEELFKNRLDQILNDKHPLFRLADAINWEYFVGEFGPLYIENKGQPGKPIRLLVALHYLKHAYDESDESVVERFLENPYWQYFCGFEYFQHEFPLDPTSLVKWRRRIGVDGMEKLFYRMLKTAQELGLLKRSHLHKVNVDTTVQEKAIAFPTDARLYYKMREKLVVEAEKRGIDLRQNYRRLGRKALVRQGRYSHARQMKRAAKETKKLKNYLGRVTRDIRRKVKDMDTELKEFLNLSERLLVQKRDDKNKLYSIHAPEVECIAKGKIHKRYEFGCKVSVATTSRDNWVVGIQAHHGNPYDGHTLKSVLEQVVRLTSCQIREVFCDRGYRGHNCEGKTKIHITGRRKRGDPITRSLRKWLKRRNAIEPKIGHLKTDNRMDRNYLKGTDGDKVNALLSGCGANLRKLIAAFFLPFLEIRRILAKITKNFQRTINAKNQLQYFTA